ncbi:MAG TPA: bifunctional methionine sulfoxide reductase B/A protein [Pirellulales bacterium]|nr:bifunctional methionine sulfoxide reductase B/A protein [Pirellulales bacterium]
MIKIHVFNNRGELVGPVESPKLSLSDDEWRKRLTLEQFRVLRSAGTERPFCGALLDNKQPGVYSCAGCGLPLFTSDAKFHSGTGWPSFFQPIAEGNVDEKNDYSHGMSRTEINCARCDGHLGHVFDDGPRPTGLRFCLNSESLKFTPNDQLATLADPLADSQGSAETSGAMPTGLDGHGEPTGMATQGSGHGTQQSPATCTAVFAGGCFWCTEAAFEQLDGVLDVTSGYSGGKRETADYESVCTGRTGHAEAIRITYDPAKISYDTLLDVFFDAHDPTQLNRQGADVGTQYRSAIFYANESERRAAETKIRQLNESHHFSSPIVTTLEPLVEFFPAEGYHQDYARNNPMQPYIQAAAIPKACKVREKHLGLIRKR